MKLDFVSAPSRNASFPLDFPFPDRAISAPNPGGTPVCNCFPPLPLAITHLQYSKRIQPRDSTRDSQDSNSGLVLRTVESTGEGGGTTKALIVRVSKRHLRFNAPSFSSSSPLQFSFPLRLANNEQPLLLLFALKRRPSRITRTPFEFALIILT